MTMKKCVVIFEGDDNHADAVRALTTVGSVEPVDVLEQTTAKAQAAESSEPEHGSNESFVPPN
jgi:hypothetical protein